MDYKFSEIILNKNELDFIKSYKSQELYTEDESVAQILKSYNLIKSVPVGTDENYNLMYDGCYEITDFGKRYLIYLEKIHKNSFWEWARYIITTLIAISALVISLLKT